MLLCYTFIVECPGTCSRSTALAHKCAAPMAADARTSCETQNGPTYLSRTAFLVQVRRAQWIITEWPVQLHAGAETQADERNTYVFWPNGFYYNKKWALLREMCKFMAGKGRVGETEKPKTGYAWCMRHETWHSKPKTTQNQKKNWNF